MRNKKIRNNQMEALQDKVRNYSFVFANDLVQNYVTLLNCKAFRLLAFMLCKVRKEDTYETQDYSFSVREYCDVCGIGCDSGRNYECVRAAFEDVKTATAIETGTCHRTKRDVIKWLESGEFDEKKHVFKYKFSDKIRPYIFKLDGNYTRIKLHEIMGLKSIYSQRLYVNMCSYRNYEKIYKQKPMLTYTAEQARVFMGCRYKRFADFRRIILEARKDIEEKTDMRLDIEIKTEEQLKHFDRVIFTIEKAAIPTDNWVIWNLKKKEMTGKRKTRE